MFSNLSFKMNTDSALLQGSLLEREVDGHEKQSTGGREQNDCSSFYLSYLNRWFDEHLLSTFYCENTDYGGKRLICED